MANSLLFFFGLSCDWWTHWAMCVSYFYIKILYSDYKKHPVGSFKYKNMKSVIR